MKILFLASLLGFAPLLVLAATESSGKLPRATPESQGISSAALLPLLDEAEQQSLGLHGIMIVRHGHVVAEGWWAPYAATEPHMLYSLSKSFTSTAVGLAQAEGRLNINDPVIKFFPEDVPAQPSDNLKAMRVRDLLAMSTGQHPSDVDPFPYGARENLVKNFLARPVAHKPGTHFYYNTAASLMLSAIVQKATGQTVLDYLRPRLFEPLGIENPTWEATADGISMGGFGLSIRTEDIARFGQLYLQKGEWQGRHLIPAEWVEAATSRQTSNGSNPESDWDQGYGYQFWRCIPGFYRGDGAFGQFCIVMPQYDTVVAINSGSSDMGAIMKLIWNRLLPELRPAAIPENPEAQAKLGKRLAGLTIPVQAGTASSPLASKVSGRHFIFSAGEANRSGVESISLDTKAGNEPTVTVKMRGAEQRVSIGQGQWLKGSFAFDAKGPVPVAVSGAWTSEDTYALQLCQYRTPFIITVRLHFIGDQVTLDLDQNVGFGPTKAPTLTGRVQ